MHMDIAENGLVLLECSTKHYKTGAKDRKDTVLPLIALGSGLTQPAWGRAWMRKRALAGLEDAACIMPAVAQGGQLLDRPMTAAEGSLWLREILHIQGFGGDLEQYSSHSLTQPFLGRQKFWRAGTFHAPVHRTPTGCPTSVHTTAAPRGFHASNPRDSEEKTQSD